MPALSRHGDGVSYEAGGLGTTPNRARYQVPQPGVLFSEGVGVLYTP